MGNSGPKGFAINHDYESRPHVPVLHAAARVEELRLGVDRDALGCEAVDLDDGGVADRFEDVVVHARLGGDGNGSTRGGDAASADGPAAEGDLLRGDVLSGEGEHGVLPVRYRSDA
jgi:hypothetical protein